METGATGDLVRHRQPKGAATDRVDLKPPRHTPTLPPLVLCRVHWVRPDLVAEVKYLTWTSDNLLRQVVYEGLREGDRGAPRGAPDLTRLPALGGFLPVFADRCHITMLHRLTPVGDLSTRTRA